MASRRPSSFFSPLYAIIDVQVCAARGLDPRALTDAVLGGGGRLLQLRDKSGSSAARLALAEDLAARAHVVGARLIVNDRPDIARLSGADGVHVGHDDMSVADARKVVGDGAIVGVSTHDEAQVDAAALTDATYIAVGPIYRTATKDTGYTARGLDLIRYAASHGRPVVAIGGITLARIPDVLAAGAASAAIISDLLEGGDASARVAACLRAARQGHV
jgi:thiamine-phosphate pyrophosphorylase